MDDETARWVADLPDDMHGRLAAVGLVTERESMRLGLFLDDYIDGRHDVKPGTRTVYGHVRRNLIGFFGAEKPLREIAEYDADQWRLYLLQQGLSENTTRRRCGLAKQLFKTALKRKLVSANPFADLKVAVKGSVAKFYFVTREEAEKVLEACPDTQWRLIFALSRYAGLRCPSEHMALTWADVDWEHSRMTIRASKTEHHEGDGIRICPLFPELLPYLREAFEEAEEGAVHVVTIYRNTSNRNCNLRTQLLRIIAKAGLQPWPKLFQNLRATRQTELCQRFPEHVVCSWLGNTPAVAREHYLRTTEEHFQQAVNPGQEEPVEGAAQNAAQYPAEWGRKEQKEPLGEESEGKDLQPLTTQYETVQMSPMGPPGFEPGTNGL
jgi:integrase